jgi:type I restriction enzyme S subunit
VAYGRCGGELGDLIHLEYGKGLKKANRTGQGYPVIGSSGVIDYHEEFLVEAPGIVIGRKGTLGETIYLTENFHPIDTTYYINSEVDSNGLYYEYFLLKSIGFEKMNSDSAVPGLNRNIALATEILIPPRELIKRFSEVVEPSKIGYSLIPFLVFPYILLSTISEKSLFIRAER